VCKGDKTNQKTKTIKADLETPSSEPKELMTVFSQSKVPLQRLICARSVSFDNDSDLVATATRLSKDVEPTVREAIATRLGQLDYGADKIRPGKAVAILHTLARDARAEVRSAAAMSLALVPNANRVSSWLNLCHDQNPRYRSSGAECLGYTGLAAANVPHPTVVQFVFPELIAMAREDLNFAVRKAACKALGRLVQDCAAWPNASAIRKGAAEAVLNLAQDSAWPVRRAVADVVPLVCPSTLDVPLGSALVSLSESDASNWVKLAAKRSLGLYLANSRSDAPEVMTAYCNLAKSPEEEVRFACAYAFPAVVQASNSTAEGERRWNASLREVHSILCADVSPRIRCTLAHSLHMVAQSIGSTATARDLHSVFASFIQDMDDEEEIRLGAIRSAAGFLASLPESRRREVFELIETTRVDVSTSPLASLAVSRDARFSLASQLVQFSAIQPPVPGLGRMFLALAQDEAHHVRQRALDSFGDIAPSLDSANDVMKEFEEMATSPHFWNRWAFARGTRSILRNERAKKMFAESSQLENKLRMLQNDPVLTVRTEATAAAS